MRQPSSFCRLFSGVGSHPWRLTRWATTSPRELRQEIRGIRRADAARVAGQGLTLALATGLFLWVGWLLDNRLGTVPVFTVLGAFVGAAAGLYSLYHHVVLEPRRQREREEHER